MPDKTIKHFVIMRFFPQRDPKYPYDIFDVDFLSKQLILANNALRSLENQSNKNFELMFLINVKFFDDPKYEFIFSTLRENTSLPVKFIKTTQRGNSISYSWMSKNCELPNLISDALKKYDFVIQSRMDFDDFVNKDAIADIQSKTNECDNILLYGYNKGYTYVYNELYPHHSLYGKEGHIGILNSLILKSSFAQNLPFISIYSFDHAIFKRGMKKFLKANHVEFSEKMFQQNTDERNYIYFRHDFSHYNLVTKPGSTDSVLKRKKFTTDDITKKQLEEKFGFFHELNSIK